MESKICENCTTIVLLKNMYIECENSHILCFECLVEEYEECPYCKGDWKTRSSKSKANKKTSEISDENDRKLQVINAKSNNLPNRSPSYPNKKKISFKQSSSNEAQNFPPYKILPSSPPKNKRRQEPSISNADVNYLIKIPKTESRRLKPTNAAALLLRQQARELFKTNEPEQTKSNENVFMVLGQPQKKEHSLCVPTKKDVRNENLNTAVKIIDKKEEECSKIRRLRREQLIAEQKTMIRQRILQDMHEKLREETYKKIVNTSEFSEDCALAGNSIEGEDIKHRPPSKEKFNETSAKHKPTEEINSKPNSSISEFKSFYSEQPSPDMSPKKNYNARVLQEELHLNLSAPKGFINHSDSESSPRVPYTFMQQKKNNEEDDLSKEFSSKCDLGTKTTRRTNSNTGSPSTEVAVLPPISEESLSRTGQRNYKDSSTEPMPSCYFEPNKLCCSCSCDKICNNEKVRSKLNQTEINDIRHKKSPSDVEIYKSKSNTNIERNLKKELEDIIEDLPSKRKSGKSVTINMKIDSFNGIDLKENETTSMDVKNNFGKADIRENENPSIDIKNNFGKADIKENEEPSMDVKNNFGKADKFEIGDYDRVEEHLDIALATFINAVLKKNPKKTISNLNDLFEVLTINHDDLIFQKSNLNNANNDEVKSCLDEIDTNEVTVEGAELNVFTVTNRLTNSWQAFCPAFGTTLKENPEAIPQIRMIETQYVNDEIMRLQQIHSIVRLNINRNPLNCPITSCKSKVFISEFAKHIKLNHVRVTIETISPGVCRNLYFDCKLIRSGQSSCQMLYLVTNKIRDFGNHEFRDFLPVLLMTTKASLFDLFCSRQQTRRFESVQNKQYYYFIWLTGFFIKEVPVYYTLIAWNRNAAGNPGCHVVNAGQLYSFRETQTAEQLYKTGQALILSQEQCNMLTDDGKNMLELQIILH